MSHALTEVAAYDPVITVPDPGDARTAASVIPAFQALADRTAFFAPQVAGLIASVPAYQTGTAMIPISGSQPDAGFVGKWVFSSSSGTAPFWLQSDVTDTGQLWIPVPGWLLPGRKAVAASVFVQGSSITGGGTHGALPATLPTIRYAFVDPTTKTIGIAATGTDPSGTAAVYDAPHFVQCAVPLTPFTVGKEYYIIVTGETGANSGANKFGVNGAAIVWL